MTTLGPLLMDDLLRAGNAQWRSADILMGHLGTLPISEAHPKHVVTVVRNPIDHLLSYYNHIRRSPDHWGHERVIGSSLSFYEWLQHPAFRFLTSNPQSRMLGIPPELPSGRYEKNNPFALQTAFEDKERSIDESELFSCVVDTLANISVVGTTEGMESFVENLCKLFSVRQFLPEKLNSSKPNEQVEIGEKELSLIRARAAVDFEVWHFVNQSLARIRR